MSAHPNLRHRLHLLQALEQEARIITDVAREFTVTEQAVRNLTTRMKDRGLVEVTDQRIPGLKTRYYRLSERGRQELERLRMELA